jgi:hypothetical protein
VQKNENTPSPGCCNSFFCTKPRTTPTIEKECKSKEKEDNNLDNVNALTSKEDELNSSFDVIFFFGIS